MSMIIRWAVPQTQQDIDQSIVSVIIQRQTGGVGPFTTIDTIDATSDAQPKSDSNTWVDTYEDMAGGPSDLYRIAYVNSNNQQGAWSGSGGGGYLNGFTELIDLIRLDLGDDDPASYQLDKIPQYRWTGTQLAKWMGSTLNEFNGTGPMITRYTFDTLPLDADHIIEEGVKFRAYKARQSKELPNVLDYNDGVSFKIVNRVQDYKSLADSAETRMYKLMDSWKKSHRPSSIGLGSQRLPFRISRPLSMLPHFGTLFGM